MGILIIAVLLGTPLGMLASVGLIALGFNATRHRGNDYITAGFFFWAAVVSLVVNLAQAIVLYFLFSGWLAEFLAPASGAAWW